MNVWKCGRKMWRCEAIYDFGFTIYESIRQLDAARESAIVNRKLKL